MSTTVTLEYQPHPKQAEAHDTLVDELLYGGSAGGGKSHWARAEHILLALLVPGSRSLILRRTFKDLRRSVVNQLKQEIPPGLGYYHHSDHEYRFHNGSIIELGHLTSDKDLDKYQGAEYVMITFEEATHFKAEQYQYLRSRLRAAGKIRDRLQELGLRPRMLLTANPGGVGHHWVKMRFVDPVPMGNRIFTTPPTLEDQNPGTRCYIPARATENPSLNPEYIAQLNRLPENLRAALRDGDWNVLEGVRFSQWSSAHHVIRPEELPVPINSGQKVIAVDYGTASPFTALWMIKLTDDMVVVYREAYAKELTPTQQAELIRDLSQEEEEASGAKIPVVCDPSMWNRATAGSAKSLNPDKPAPGTPAHAYMTVLERTPIKAVNARVNGWTLVDEHLRVREDGLSRFLVYETCRNLIRTLPALPRDTKNPEDVDTTAEDHAPDAARYGLQFLAGRRVLTPEERRAAAGRAEHNPQPLTAGLGSAGF